MNEKEIADNKVFWKTITLLLSHKVLLIDKIHLSENGIIIKSEFEAAEVLNNFFRTLLNFNL